MLGMVAISRRVRESTIVINPESEMIEKNRGRTQIGFSLSFGIWSLEISSPAATESVEEPKNSSPSSGNWTRALWRNTFAQILFIYDYAPFALPLLFRPPTFGLRDFDH